MKRLYSKISFVAITLISLISLSSCHNMPVGYLKAENAGYEPDTLVVYKEVDEYAPQVTDNSPWTSYAIQGVAGTVPITYEFYDVEATEGGDAAAFRQAIQEGTIRLQGSLIQVFYAASKNLPEGRYSISLKVQNEDHSALLPHIFTVIIKKNEFGDWDNGSYGDEDIDYTSLRTK